MEHKDKQILDKVYRRRKTIEYLMSLLGGDYNNPRFNLPSTQPLKKNIPDQAVRHIIFFNRYER